MSFGDEQLDASMFDAPVRRGPVELDLEPSHRAALRELLGRALDSETDAVCLTAITRALRALEAAR